MISDDMFIALGIAASVLILTGWVSQVIHGYRVKHLRDVSRYLLVLVGIGAMLWTIYGIVLSDPYIIGTNTTAIVLMILVYFMKRRYDIAEYRRYQGW